MGVFYERGKLMAMREILFRGKRKDNGEWVYGYFVNEPNGVFIMFNTINAGIVKHKLYEVIPETVGQYTGIYDKNGKKIFEGDIVKMPLYEGCQEKTIAVVDWDILCAVFYLHGKRVNTDFYHYFGNDCEVIGNIHDKKLEDFENGC